MVRKLKGSAIQSGTITTTQLSAELSSSISSGGGPKVSSLVYPGDDTAANTAGGQTVYINGSGFAANSNVYINGNAVPSISFISASNLAITTPALSAATYPVYVINPEDSSVGIYIPGLEVSGEPTWSTSATLSEQGADFAWSISLSATSDSSVTYALANGSSLPAGISLAANGLISGTLSSPPNDDTTYNFTVVATDSENQDASRAFSVVVSVADEYFKETVLLLHGDGTNNQNNHHFIDSSNNNFTITRNGNATQGSFSPFSQTGWSIEFENTINAQSTSGKYLSIANTSAFNIGTGDFTLEGWIYPFQLPSSDSWPTNWWQHSLLFGRGTPSAGDGYNLILGATKLIFQNNDGEVANGTHNITPYNWYHVAASRSGGTLKLFVNGSEVATTSTSFTGGGGSNFYIGTETGQGGYFNGYMSNIRLVVGDGLYTSSFTPTTESLSAVSNTALLIAQSNRYIDNSTNSYTVTPQNTPFIRSFSPFRTTQKYSTANNGASGYFDGSGDFLNFTGSSETNLGGLDWTFECWFYQNAKSGGVNAFIQSTTGTNNWIPYFSAALNNSNKLLVHLNAAEYTTTQSYNLGEWNHMAVVRYSGVVKVYLNGQATSISQNTDIGGGNLSFVIGKTDNFAGYLYYYNGYISDMRLIKGSALYTSNFTPPSSPLTNVPNTSLLCKFANAGIFDSTAKNVLETVGDAKVSTAQYKYGTGSMYFDGTGDYCRTQNTSILGFGSGDYTVEFWAYASSYSSTYMTVFDNRFDGREGFALYMGGPTFDANKVLFTNQSQIQFTTSTTLTINTWLHIACVRYNNNVSIYINGTNAGANASSSTVDSRVYASSTSAFIGGNAGGTQLFNGYIDDLRITKGVARYTSNFTPPTSALKDK